MFNDKDLYEIGETPPLGITPKYMYAQVIRKERYGDPLNAFKIEVVDTPEIKDDEILIWVMTAGVNYNNIWAANGTPIDVINMHQKEDVLQNFHIGGSDCAGIVWKIGRSIKTRRVGDEVIVSCGIYNEDNKNLIHDKSEFKIWGYEKNFGAFGQFSVVKEYQCFDRPKNLNWSESGCFLLTAATAYRQLMHWKPNTLKKGAPVLIWGGAGGLGTMALQLCRAYEADAVAVVSSLIKAEWCRENGAVGVLNRRDFPYLSLKADADSFDSTERKRGYIKFRKSYYQQLGRKELPEIVFEHTGQLTIDTSLYMCNPGGMVVTCGATSGYNCNFDVRYLWCLHKRIQGSHFASIDNCSDVIKLVERGLINSGLTKIYTFDQIGIAHQALLESSSIGNLVIKINCL